MFLCSVPYCPASGGKTSQKELCIWSKSVLWLVLYFLICSILKDLDASDTQDGPSTSEDLAKPKKTTMWQPDQETSTDYEGTKIILDIARILTAYV